MTTNLQNSVRPRLLLLPLELLFTAFFSANALAAVQDVMLQTMDGKAVTGTVNDVTGVGTLGQRVFGGQLQKVGSNLRTSNPGFFGLRTGDANVPPGASGFPSEHEVSFDLLPMSIENVASNLFYWNGSDANGGGVDITDVDFVVQPGVFWDVFDANFATFTASGTDQSVPGGLIDVSSEDIWPDGIDSGPVHRHLALQVRDSDGNSMTTAAEGVYLISWQVRLVGFETSDPIFFVHRTPMISDAVRDVAVAWVEANIEMLTLPPQLTGDYNADGSVDAADYVVWRKTLSQSAFLAADGNGNEEIDDGDYTVWVEHFGESAAPAGGGAFSIPEPPGSWLVLIGLAGYPAIFSHRRRFGSKFWAVRIYSGNASVHFHHCGEKGQ